MVRLKIFSSISIKIFLMSIATGVVVFGGYILASSSLFNSIFDGLYKKMALSTTNSLNAALGIDDLSNSEKLQEVINQFIYQNPEIEKLNINLADKNNQLVVVASNVSNLIGETTSLSSQQDYLSNEVIQQKVNLDNGDQGIEVVAPVVVGGQKVGVYELYISTQQAWIQFQQILVYFLVLMAFFVFGVAMTFYLLVRKSLVLPIKKLIIGVGEVGRGNLNYRIELNSTDEIGQLAAAFNDSTGKLADLYNNLENRVKERTGEVEENLQKIKEQNTILEDNKKAMINILEDDRELQKELETEKAGVEKKVEERTLELSEAKAKLDSSIENLPLGFLMVGIEENFIVTNSLANKVLGGKSGKDRLLTLKKILKVKIDLGKYIKNCGKERKGLNISDVEIEGRFFQFLLSPILTKELKGLCIGVVVLIQDVTEAKILNRSKDEFFSIASHELRTPLTAIRGNTSMILEYYAKALKDPELKAMVDDVHESSIRLINIVNDFLNVSRLEQGRMTFEIKDFDIGKLILETIKEYDVTGSRKKIGIEYLEPENPLPQVSADGDKVRQVLINLLGNALKFTSKGNIKIKAEKAGDMVKVSVSDTGRGIPLKQQSLLFHKFQQAGESLFTRDTAGGSGLGLYISRMMIEGMKGEIELEKSEEDVGSTFSFTLPMVKSK